MLTAEQLLMQSWSNRNSVMSDLNEVVFHLHKSPFLFTDTCVPSCLRQTFFFPYFFIMSYNLFLLYHNIQIDINQTFSLATFDIWLGFIFVQFCQTKAGRKQTLLYNHQLPQNKKVKKGTKLSKNKTFHTQTTVTVSGHILIDLHITVCKTYFI